jgi:SET domain-containing protein
MPAAKPKLDTATSTPTSTRIAVRSSGIHGLGVFATARIATGTPIGRYEGRRYTAKQAARRSWDQAVTYVFGVSDGSLIDGADGGNATRHINHSCAPNCVAYEVQGDDGMVWIEIEALKTIASGAELLLDYSLNVDQATPDDYPCRCGARLCRGTLIAATD